MIAVSDGVQLAIIAGVMLVVKQVLDWVSMFVKIRLDDKRAAELATVTKKSATELKEHLGDQDDKLEVIRRENNGAKDQLVKEVRAAAFAAGEKSEADKLPIKERE